MPAYLRSTILEYKLEMKFIVKLNKCVNPSIIYEYPYLSLVEEVESIKASITFLLQSLFTIYHYFPITNSWLAMYS